MRVLVTGSAGLIGSALIRGLSAANIQSVGYDIRHAAQDDIRDAVRLEQALAGVDGVVHLAAISRVVMGQNDPARCRAINVDALSGLLGLLGRHPQKPWIIFGSSREVYGEALNLPVLETAPMRPMNVYAQSKVDGEALVTGAREQGLTANVCRFSTVYGSVDDHADRLVPAFARAAALGGVLRVDGSSNTLDATHVDDVVDGLIRLIRLTASGENIDPIHFVSGRGVTIGDLAKMAQRESGHSLRVQEATPRDYDVSNFVGDPSRCQSILDWQTTTPIEAGFRALVRDFGSMTAQ